MLNEQNQSKEEGGQEYINHSIGQQTERDLTHSQAQQSLMCLNAYGQRIASQSLYLYFIWLVQLHILELKIQCSAYFLKNKLLKSLMHFAYLYPIQMFLKSAIVFIVFFFYFNYYKKSQKVTPFCSVMQRTLSQYFQIKDMIAFPQFLGMFFVSFLSLFQRRSRCFFCYESSSIGSSFRELELGWLDLHFFYSLSISTDCQMISEEEFYSSESPGGSLPDTQVCSGSWRWMCYFCFEQILSSKEPW